MNFKDGAKNANLIFTCLFLLSTGKAFEANYLVLSEDVIEDDNEFKTGIETGSQVTFNLLGLTDDPCAHTHTHVVGTY